MEAGDIPVSGPSAGHQDGSPVHCRIPAPHGSDLYASPAVLMVRTARGRSAARTTTNTQSAVPAPEDPYAAAR
jgi:hypothetical protein